MGAKLLTHIFIHEIHMTVLIFLTSFFSRNILETWPVINILLIFKQTNLYLL